jgi:hypothetical protein
VKVTKYFAPTIAPTSAAARVIAPPFVLGVVRNARIISKPPSSVRAMMRAIVATASIANAPTDVSPDNINASAPSSTALAQSVASARVGEEFVIIESSI